MPLSPVMTSYRQLDYWTRLGVIKPLTKALPGSGHARRWSQTELAVAEMIGQLRSTGLKLEIAAEVARTVIESDHEAGTFVVVPIGPEVELAVRKP